MKRLKEKVEELEKINQELIDKNEELEKCNICNERNVIVNN